MKKAIVLLLALTLIGGAAFAQVTTAVYLHGKVTLIDQDMSGNFNTDNWAADAVTFKASKDTVGFSMTYRNPLEGSAAALTAGVLSGSNPFAVPRDWNAYYKLFDNMVTVTVGNLRNGTYRMGNVYGVMYTDRISGYGILTDIVPMENLKIGVNLPFGTTAADTVEVLQKADVGASYTITDLGKVIFLANLDLVNSSNIINFGFSLSAVENLAAVLTYKGTLATTSTHAFGVGAQYTLLDGALAVGVEFDGQFSTDLAFQVYPYASYDLNDNVNLAFDGYYDSDSALDLSATATYAFGNGLSANLTAGYADAVYYNVGVTYEVAF